MASATPVTIASVVKTVGAWMSARKNDQPRLSPLIGGGGGWKNMDWAHV